MDQKMSIEQDSITAIVVCANDRSVEVHDCGDKGIGLLAGRRGDDDKVYSHMMLLTNETAAMLIFALRRLEVTKTEIQPLVREMYKRAASKDIDCLEVPSKEWFEYKAQLKAKAQENATEREKEDDPRTDDPEGGE